ncbi:cytochrome c oxidase accessory protein CcoG [Phaeobacter gallaeciensis]|uniref:Cytochrome c oxidase accessory protein CcoG n=2 Tax=Phaeobacter gallaeciensis TaxID=60890 RepID=A0ABD4XCA9_9RHOB|nr:MULTISPECIES: cytochrome c oxidase accessory protein CcoG [Phaeobacter]MDF1772219.1 cytochrome c oxidase accessory protein CcoG [Pseudophaeobacter sp. bin_em_oilr2.035]MEC9310400.1 cytochrome c oxidase accessory protein CcoG [Pseudomonadota bacterium]MDE4145903.1 cytochrome c oxidase accessory protein CcoG [Phaeobacter gallaeciensis]MDE4158576.1 cytochrome c oxidase accessory protein CcoG [Phaeobacter gallaeciensis]MDE4162753.1 cytochrome c oxidase accessory protein CcoG [Phaeobacter gallae
MSDSDPAPSLYAAREPIFPRRVSGMFRNLKWYLMAVMLGIYYITPWIRWDRGPSLPDQAVLLDLANRRFYFFWIEIWPHEFYFVAGLLIMAGLGLFLFTSALGRVWCGYACPQTVWTDLFILVERWIEGDRNARLRLHRQKKMDFRKARLRVTKWAAWFLIGLATGGAWIFYFSDAPTLLHDLVTLQAHPIAYTTMLVLTLTTFFFGGFAREQICIYACPWPRIQAAMMDEDTLTVGYREWRGEPRGKHRKSAESQEMGDCIDCMACVNVCPMGIDIRDGQQLECITCALCIDACDDVMAKIGKPRGLIDYMALSDEANERAGQPPRSVWKHILRPRTIMYTSLWAVVGFALVFALFIRPDIDLTVAPVRNPTFVTLSDGSVRNTYDVRLRNKHGEPRQFELSIKGEPEMRIQLEGTPYASVQVPADTAFLQRVYIVTPKGAPASGAESTPVRIWVEDLNSGERAYKDTTFNGKGN